jgi:hypothetical protein
MAEPRRSPRRRRPLPLPAAALLVAALGPVPAGGPPTARAQMLGTHMDAIALEPARGGPVTGWTIAADLIGGGSVNWRTLAVMHIAMHDALNAAEPRHARATPPAPGEPTGALAAAADAPELAMAAAAYQVLLARHPEQAPLVGDPLFRRVHAAAPAGPARAAAVELGAAIGLAAAERYRASTAPPTPFPQGTEPGRWRPTPPFRLASAVGDARPFLFGAAEALRGPPPPALGSPDYVAAVEEVRRLGDDRSRERTAEQTAAAEFWGGQTSQRGFLHLAVRLVAEHPPPGGLWEEARGMALLTMALADSYILAWDMKRRYAFWRPITAINEGGHGVAADPGWYPLLPTPPHPDYPSGHAADCATGAHLLQGLFGDAVREVAYTAVDAARRPTRRYPSLAAAAEECAASRLWAGAHFRPANEEGLRIGRLIAERALTALPPLPPR